MEPYQWFLVGVMAAWTPGLVALAVMLGLSNSEHRNFENSDR
jgi:hypothetical protein